MATRPTGLTGGILAVAAVLALGGAGAARAVAETETHAHESATRHSAEGTARAFVTAVGGVGQSVGTLALLAPQVGHAPATPPASLAGVIRSDGVSGVVLVPVTGAPVVVAGTVPRTVALAGLARSLEPALDVARDTADPHAAAVGRGVGIAVAVYDGTPISTEQRRAEVTGWVVALVDPSALLARIAGAADTAVIDVGGRLVTDAAARGRFSVEASVDLAGQPWRIVVTPRTDGTSTPAAWGVLVAALIGALGVTVVGLRSRHALDRAVATNEALERETRTVAELGPLLQQSLDLAEVLPAVAVRLSDEFALDAFAVELIGEHGELVDVFGVGRRTSSPEPRIVGAEGIDAGVEMAIPLLRGGRTIGRLRLVARERLTPTQVDALRGAADLIAVATYNVELYEREQATVRRLQELDRLKDAFLGTISHELRTPITAISGFARMLNDRWDDLSEDQRRDFLRRVGRNSASLGLLVDDLLDFARLERQALSTSVSPLGLDAVVSSFVAQVVPALGDHPVETDLAQNVMAMADPRAIERVLANLLTNAAKFSPKGSPVEVTLRTADSTAVLSVADHGPGIAEEDRLRVFTRFYRGESEIARSTRGAGIGLAVVHELVTQMGGDIEVHPREPQGTVVVVRLPLAPPTAPPAPRSSTDDRIPARSTP